MIDPSLLISLFLLMDELVCIVECVKVPSPLFGHLAEVVVRDEAFVAFI